MCAVSILVGLRPPEMQGFHRLVRFSLHIHESYIHTTPHSLLAHTSVLLYQNLDENNNNTQQAKTAVQYAHIAVTVREYEGVLRTVCWVHLHVHIVRDMSSCGIKLCSCCYR